MAMQLMSEVKILASSLSAVGTKTLTLIVNCHLVLKGRAERNLMKHAF